MPELELIHGDRRSDRRYAVGLNLRFSVNQAGQARAGTGNIVDLSRGGVRFYTDSPPPCGAKVELQIEWPLLLQNVCPLELLVHGTVLRIENGETVIRTHDYAFRTCGTRSFDQQAAPSRTCNFTA